MMSGSESLFHHNGFLPPTPMPWICAVGICARPAVKKPLMSVLLIRRIHPLGPLSGGVRLGFVSAPETHTAETPTRQDCSRSRVFLVPLFFSLCPAFASSVGHYSLGFVPHGTWFPLLFFFLPLFTGPDPALQANAKFTLALDISVISALGDKGLQMMVNGTECDSRLCKAAHMYPTCAVSAHCSPCMGNHSMFHAPLHNIDIIYRVTYCDEVICSAGLNKSLEHWHLIVAINTKVYPSCQGLLIPAVVPKDTFYTTIHRNPRYPIQMVEIPYLVQKASPADLSFNAQY